MAAGYPVVTSPRIIAFCSPAMGSGKTTAAERLVSHHGFRRIAFATPLKHMASGLLDAMGFSFAENYDRISGSRKEEMIPVLGITSRDLQQKLGTEFGRKMIRESLWVDITMSVVQQCLAAGESVVIDDMRFPNEYEALLAAGADCRRIVRPDATVTRSHVSEGALDGIHMPEIWNVGDLDEFLGRIDRLAQETV